MGRSGTDVAREAADLVLLDDDFATIVAAIEQGRATFANIRRFLTYHLTDNVAELTPFVVWALSGGRFPLALGVLQILALDIGTDLLPALALGAEPPARRPLRRPPVTAPPPRPRACSAGSSACSARPRPPSRWPRSSPCSSAAGWRPGDAFPDRRAAARRLGRRVRRGRARPGGQRLRLPQHRAAAVALGWTTNRLLLGARGGRARPAGRLPATSRRSPTCSTRRRRPSPGSRSRCWPFPPCSPPTPPTRR